MTEVFFVIKGDQLGHLNTEVFRDVNDAVQNARELVARLAHQRGCEPPDHTSRYPGAWFYAYFEDGANVLVIRKKVR